jgi:hypothetical protein
MPLRRTFFVAATLAVTAACQRDPGRDVRPMTTGPASVLPASAEILPLEKVAKSQAAVVGQRVANTEITITYSRPVARGRELFGALVPFDQVWNPGADQATAIAFTRDVRINDRPLAAAKYSVWAVPRADRWTMIFSRAADVYHIPYPGEAQDALRLDIVPESGPHMETLSFYFPVVEGKEATLRLHWGETMVPMKITVP